MTSSPAHLTFHRTLPQSLSAFVTQTLERYPDFDEHDIAGLIEEKTGVPLNRRDFEAVRAWYLRAKLRAWSPDAVEADL